MEIMQFTIERKEFYIIDDNNFRSNNTNLQECNFLFIIGSCNLFM